MRSIDDKGLVMIKYQIRQGYTSAEIREIAQEQEASELSDRRAPCLPMRSGGKLKTELQELQAKRNKASIEISEAKKKGQEIKPRRFCRRLASLKDADAERMEADVAKYEAQDRCAGSGTCQMYSTILSNTARTKQGM
jgi:seryl-tRNA synthetase